MCQCSDISFGTAAEVLPYAGHRDDCHGDAMVFSTADEKPFQVDDIKMEVIKYKIKCNLLLSDVI